MVIGVHTFFLGDLSFYLNLFITNGIFRFAVPFFFLLAGYFYGKKCGISHVDNYAKKYIVKILKIFFLWALFYFPYDYIYMLVIKKGIPLPHASFLYIKNSLFGGFEGVYFHLWYLIAVSLGIFIFDKLNGLNLTHKSIIKYFFIFFYLIGLSGSGYYGVWKLLGYEHLIVSYESVFITTRNGAFFALPFIYLGYRISFIDITTYSYNELIVKMALSLTFLFTEIGVLTHYKMNHFLFGYDMTIGIVFFSFYLFIFILKDPLKNIVIKNDYSLNTYLSQGIFLAVVYRLPWKRYSVNYFIVCTLSFLIAYLINKLQYLKRK